MPLGPLNIAFPIVRVECTNGRRTWQISERSVHPMGLPVRLTAERVAVPAATLLRQRFPTAVR